MKNLFATRVVALTALLTACEGELPEYLDPRDVFTAEINGLYVLSASDNSLKIFLTAKNRFDETFEAEAVLQGNIRVTLASDPSIQKTFSLSASELISARGYNPQTRVLRIDPGDSVRFSVSWDFVADNGTDLLQDVFRYVPDSTCLAEDHPTCLSGDRRIARAQDFSLEGEVVIYRKINSVQTRVRTFTLCHVNKWVPSNCCGPIVGNGCLE